jgi:hypothetical protein
MRGYVLMGCTLSLFACGGGEKKTVKKPKTETVVQAPPKEETEEDRAKKRLEAAQAIVPEGSSCLPASLKEEGGPRLEVAAAGADAILCAVDTQQDRLLGPVGCWKIDLATGGLAYKAPDLMPGRGSPVMLDNKGCAWGYCLPKEAKTSGNSAFIAKDIDGSKVALLAGDDVHIFDAASKAHESTFTIRGDKGVTNDPSGLHFVSGHVVVEGADQGAYSAVWVFKADGTQMGPVVALGSKDNKPMSTYKGSVSILDDKRIGVGEKGLETMTTFQVDTGARAKIVRKMKTKPSCKAAELDAYWHGEDKVSDKCKASIEKLYGPLIGATGVAGRTSFLMVLRGSRLGELAALDQKTLEEKKNFKLEWCGGEGEAKSDADAKKE